MAGRGQPYNPCDLDDDTCTSQMSHQDTVLLIWVFSIFGFVLVLLVCSFYACHLYAQRLERLHPRTTAAAPQVRNLLCLYVLSDALSTCGDVST